MESLREAVWGPLLFLLHINDNPNSSDKLSFRIFADDTNLFASSYNWNQLESIVNEELTKVKLWYDKNGLSVNLRKTNFMITKSPWKKGTAAIDIHLMNHNGTNYSLEKKDHIKYLGVMVESVIK